MRKPQSRLSLNNIYNLNPIPKSCAEEHILLYYTEFNGKSIAISEIRLISFYSAACVSAQNRGDIA